MWMWMRHWWFQKYFSFISTNMKFSHIHIIMHRNGGGFGGKGRVVSKVANGFFSVSTSDVLLKVHWGRAAKMDTPAKAG